MGSSSIRCYCAFCRSERTVYRKRHLSILDVGLCLLSSFLLMLLCWQDFDPRVLPIVAFSLGVSEIFVMIRWRMTVACPECGFDPILYKKDAKATAEKVKAHLDRRRADPSALMAPPPKLPFLIKKVERTAAPKAPQVSKSSKNSQISQRI